MIPTQKIKDVNTEYKLTKDFNIGLSIENFSNIQREFSTNGGKLKSELLDIQETIKALIELKEQVNQLETRGQQFIGLKKETDLFVKNKLAILDDITVLEHILTSDKNFYILVSSFERKIENYIGEVEFKMNDVLVVIKNTDIETKQLQAYTDIYNGYIVLIDNLDKELKNEFMKINNYLDVLKDFKWEEYEATFNGWKFKS